MASITTSNGNRTIQFVGSDGKRRSIRLGKAPAKNVEEVCRRVEYIRAANGHNVSLDAETVKWLGSIDDRLHRRLAAVGLVTAREKAGATQLKPFIDAYIAGRTDAKERTVINLRMFGDRLVKFFGAERDITTIKRSDADAWLIYLKGNYAPATVGRTLKGARQLFKAACRAEIIVRNPFEGLKAAETPDKDRQFFITHEATQRVLEACPDVEWRLTVALSRYGGLRCPSEHLALTWADVDWQNNRFRVASTKTGERWVPLFPELRPYLEEAFEAAAEGAVYLITTRRDTLTNRRTRFTKIIRRAGLTPWPKLFHNLRASRETELADVYPEHVVCAWIGNSPKVAKKHYLQVLDEHFQRAAESGAVALQKEVQQPAAPSCTESQDMPQPVSVASDCETMRDDASLGQVKSYAWRDSNYPQVSKGNPAFLENSAAHSGASDADLARVVAAWPTLAAAIRRGIVAMVRTAEEKR